MPDLDAHAAEIDRIACLLKEVHSILFITGAGISADSGLPTYRGIGGLYNSETTEDGLPIERLLSGSMLQRHPELTWKYLQQVESACRGAVFNRAHQIIAEMESTFDRVWTLTQNVDGLHQQAGSRQVIDIHGNLRNLLCARCGYETAVESYSELTIPPPCPDCDHVLRPDVVLFGEMLPVDKIGRLQDELTRGFDLVFSIGTTSVFPYIAQPVWLAHQERRPTVEINPGRSEVSEIVDIKLPLRAAEAMTAIWSRFQSLDR